MSTDVLTVVLLMVNICAVVGCYLFVWLQRKLKLDAVQVIAMQLCFYASFALYGCCGLIPGAQFGMKRQWEMWFFGVLHGLLIGSCLYFF